MEAAGLESTLADANGEFTGFAPTDEAFEALPDGTLDNLLADPEQLSNILLYHVIAHSAVASDTALSRQHHSGHGKRRKISPHLAW